MLTHIQINSNDDQPSEAVSYNSLPGALIPNANKNTLHCQAAAHCVCVPDSGVPAALDKEKPARLHATGVKIDRSWRLLFH